MKSTLNYVFFYYNNPWLSPSLPLLLLLIIIPLLEVTVDPPPSHISFNSPLVQATNTVVKTVVGTKYVNAG